MNSFFGFGNFSVSIYRHDFEFTTWNSAIAKETIVCLISFWGGSESYHKTYIISFWFYDCFIDLLNSINSFYEKSYSNMYKNIFLGFFVYVSQGAKFVARPEFQKIFWNKFRKKKSSKNIRFSKNHSIWFSENWIFSFFFVFFYNNFWNSVWAAIFLGWNFSTTKLRSIGMLTFNWVLRRFWELL